MGSQAQWTESGPGGVYDAAEDAAIAFNMGAVDRASTGPTGCIITMGAMGVGQTWANVVDDVAVGAAARRWPEPGV